MKKGYLGVRIEEEIEKRLKGLSEKTHVPKSFYVSEALRMYLEEIEDYEISFERLRDKKDKVIKSEDFWREVENEL
ncbi:MAG TPA: ribbon-helix-helix domain-containing protein [bacterium]|nr:ribbon-helix-helix domain-containing protein [bacterium]